jgi:hypothetical protein
MLASVLSELHNNFGWYTSFHVDAVGAVYITAFRILTPSMSIFVMACCGNGMPPQGSGKDPMRLGDFEVRATVRR